jgi:hypothetical protein
VDSRDSKVRRAPGRGRGLARALRAALPLAIGLSLALAGPAIAQNDPTQEQYCEEGVVNPATGECESVGVVDPSDPVADPSATAASAPSSAGGAQGGDDDRVVGSLPFTGVDLAVLGVVALVLLGAGFLLRRLSALREP